MARRIVKGCQQMLKQRISYVPLDKMDEKMRAEMARCQREGTPRPESSAIRAHVPGCFWFFAESWHNIFRNGVLDHAIKELCRLYVSRSVTCEYCGNQRSVKATTSGAVIEEQVLDLLTSKNRPNTTNVRRLHWLTPKPSFGVSTPTMPSGTACVATLPSPNWSSSAA
jgi:hypothetical protein